MKTLLLILTISLLTNNIASAKETNPQQYRSQNGTLSFSCNDSDMCNIKINGKKFDEEYYIPNQDGFVDSYNQQINGLYLLKLYHGDACPSMYQLIHLYSAKDVYISEIFGNCNDIILNILTNKIAMHFNKFKGIKREPLFFHYLLLKHQLIQIPTDKKSDIKKPH